VKREARNLLPLVVKERGRLATPPPSRVRAIASVRRP
jgi:hypothetical protein